MAKFDSKVNGNTVDASEYNNMVLAFKNSIEDSGQTIDSSNTQNSKGFANNAAAANFYVDSGIADAYVLTNVGTFKAPTIYQDGMLVRFRAGNASTGVSTVNAGALGVKNIKLEDGITDITTQITTDKDTFLRFDSGNDAFQLLELVSGNASTTSRGKSYLLKQITVSNGTDAAHDIDFTAGNFQFGDGSGQAVSAALTKQIDATWVAGDNVGGLDTGTVALDETYHMFAIYDSTNSVADYIFSLSPTSPTMPGTYDKQRKIASLVTDGSANILNGVWTFNNDGSYMFRYINEITDVSAALSATPVTDSLTIPPLTLGIVSYRHSSASSNANGVSSSVTDLLNSITNVSSAVRTASGTSMNNLCHPMIQVDSSSQFEYFGSEANAGAVTITTQGWLDNNL